MSCSNCDCDCNTETCDDCLSATDENAKGATQLPGGQTIPQVKPLWATGKDFTIPSGQPLFEVFVTGKDVTITLPQSPRVGDEVEITGSCANVTVVGQPESDDDDDDCSCDCGENGWPICEVDPDVVYKCTTTTYRFTSKCTWAVQRGGAYNALGTGEILVDDYAAIIALDDENLPANVYARARTSDAQFELLPTSTVDTDGRTVLPTKSSNAGASAGRWVRNELPCKRWALAYLGGSLSTADVVTGGAFVDPVNGDDENDGLSATSAADHVGPVKTVAEICSRLRQAQAGRNYFVSVLNDVPLEETTVRTIGTTAMQAKVMDRFRPSFTSEANPESFNQTLFNQVSGLGTDQPFNMTLIGRTTDVTGAVATTGAYTATSTAQAVVTLSDTTLAAAHLGELCRVTTSDVAGNVNATFAIGKDLTSGVTRISNPTAQPGLTFVPGSFNGDTINVVQKTKWYPPFIQAGDSQGRYVIADLDFPAPQAAPAEQCNLGQRSFNATFFRCVFRRPEQASFGTGITLQAGSVNFPLLTVMSMIGGAMNHANMLLRNVDLQITNGVTFYSPLGAYFEGGRVVTYATTSLPDYGGLLGAAATEGPCRFNIGTGGLSIYNWPATLNNAGLVLSDGTVCRAGDRIRGGMDTYAGGEVGILIRSNSSLLISDALATTGWIVGDSGGTGADVRIHNPSGTTDLACRCGQGSALANPVVPAGLTISSVPIATAGQIVITDALQLKTWALYNSPTDFNKHAFNPKNNCYVMTAPTL